MNWIQLTCYVCVCFVATVVHGKEHERPPKTWPSSAPALPPPRGEVIRVTNVTQLFRAADQVRPGGTILVADGHYMMPRYFELRTNSVTLRSESGRRERVVLDGVTSRHGELVGVRGCSDVTIADLTIQNIKWNGFKLNSNHNVQRITIYNCVIRNVWQRGVKGVSVPAENRDETRPRGCRIQYCLFTNDRPKRYSDDPADRPSRFQGNYIGGIDAMFATDWIISDNVFVGIQGRTHEARGAIFLWHDSRNCIIERNLIIDCDSGVCLGNSSKRSDFAAHCHGCIVRNNFIVRAPENSILADHTNDCSILHNTVYDPKSRKRRLIRLVHSNDGLTVANNLLCGSPLTNQSAGAVRLLGNFAKPDLKELFVSPDEGDLRLLGKAEAIPRCRRLSSAKQDFDGKQRSATTPVGAHEPRSLKP